MSNRTFLLSPAKGGPITQNGRFRHDIALGLRQVRFYTEESLLQSFFV